MRRYPASVALVALLALACTGGSGVDSGLAEGAARPDLATFPSVVALAEDGTLDLAREDWPMAEGGTPPPLERLRARTGFSPVQTTVLDLGEELDEASLPTVEETLTGGSVQLWDLTEGARLPALVELDAWPDNPEVPVLLVRPLVPMSPGHRVAVAVTSELRAADGGALEPVAWWADAVAGRPHADLAGSAAHMAEVHDQLVSLGLDDLLLVTDFPVDDPSGVLEHMLAQVSTPTSWEWTRIRDADEGDTLSPGLWRALEGRFEGESWLVDDLAFEVDADGLPVAQAPAEVNLWVYLPDSLREAEVGTAPVWLFGHGIFAEPDDYLDNETDHSGVIDLADRAGAVVIASEWRGLTTRDRLVGVEVGNDFGRLPELTDKLAQGVVNNAALVRLAREGGLLEDELLGGLGDPETLRYYGISLGGIEGATLFAHTPELEAAVFHVGGSSWSTMLERSSNWSVFEMLMEDSVPSPRDRQLLYSLSQLYWDPADPAVHTLELQGRSALWQEAVYDEQVANMTTELLARAAEATVLEPADLVPLGLSSASGPLSGPALARFDPETEVVHEENRPAEVTGAHDAVRRWEGAKAQTLRFLDATDPGVVEHFCGDTVCSASNTGE